MVEAVLLGIAQDGGRPQAGCVKDCCKDISPFDEAYPVALGLVEEDTFHLIDVSRFLARQLRFMNAQSIGHVFLTHAHFGHVDGLGLFGKETMNLRGIHSISRLRCSSCCVPLPTGTYCLNKELWCLMSFHMASPLRCPRN